jgi:glycosyltransferase involved in cell wall biosynthesis
MSTSTQLSIVIPAFNESKRLAAGRVRLQPILEKIGVEFVEIIVVDDGSTDDTLKAAHAVFGDLPHALFVQQPHNMGKGAALRLGMALASGSYIITADADQAINPEHFPAIMKALLKSEVAPGSRAQGRNINYDSRIRTIAGAVFNRVVRHYTKSVLRDTQCGCKGFQLAPGRLLALFGRVDRFAFDAEILYLAEKLGFTISPVAVTWTDVPGSSVRVGRDSLEMLRDVRNLHRTDYVNPAVELSPATDIEEIRNSLRQLRVAGAVLARNEINLLVVLPKDAALSGHSLAQELKGQLRTTTMAEVRGRSLLAL